MESKLESTTKVCEYCGGLFTPNNGHQRYCTSSCQLTNWRLNNIEWNKEYGRQYREENRDKIKEYAKTYREANRGKFNKEYYKKYRETHKEKIAEKNKRYRESHKEKLAAYKKKYYEVNKEQIRDKKKVHYKANKEIYVERQTKYLKKIYEQCEKGKIKNTLGHKLFDYLNKKPYVSLNEVKTAFYKYNPNYVNSIYYIWINLTIEKYVIVS